MPWRWIGLAVLLSGTASADSLPPQTVKPPGTSATAAQAVQGVSGGVAVPISGSVTVSSASVTQGTSPWVTADNHTTAAAPLSCRASDGAAFYDARQIRALTVSDVVGLGAGSAVIGHVINDASSAVIGHVIHDSGSTTVVTGNVTVVQPTGTNLHAVLDTTSTTACTQATGTNLHAVLDTTSTTAVTQATGTNLHAVLDTTSTTAVTQATAANLNAQVVGTAADGSAASGNPVAVAGKGFNASNFAPRYCDKIIAVTTLSTSLTVQQIAGVANQKVYICGYYIIASTATTAVTLKWSEGTGGACGTGTANVTPAIFTTPTSAPTTANFTLGPWGNGAIPWMATAGDGLCITQSSGTNATTLSGVIFYTQN